MSSQDDSLSFYIWCAQAITENNVCFNQFWLYNNIAEKGDVGGLNHNVIFTPGLSGQCNSFGIVCECVCISLSQVNGQTY